MKKDYTDDQQRIYNAYVEKSTQTLLEIFGSNKGAIEEIEIVEEILIERKSLPKTFNIKSTNGSVVPEEEEIDYEKEDYIRNERIKRQSDVTLFIEQLEKNSDEELLEIIYSYKNYQLAYVEAALTIREQRGLITVSKKEELLTQIEDAEYQSIKTEKEEHFNDTSEVPSYLIYAAIFIVVGILAASFVPYKSMRGYVFTFFAMVGVSPIINKLFK